MSITTLSPNQLRQAADLQEQIQELQGQLRQLLGGELSAPAPIPVKAAAAPAGRRGVSAEGRARMAVAQRARWAKKRGTKLASPAKQASQPDPTVEKPKRIMTAAWKKALAVSAKARWARFRAAKQAAVSDLPF